MSAAQTASNYDFVDPTDEDGLLSQSDNNYNFLEFNTQGQMSQDFGDDQRFLTQPATQDIPISGSTATGVPTRVGSNVVNRNRSEDDAASDVFDRESLADSEITELSTKTSEKLKFEEEGFDDVEQLDELDTKNLPEWACRYTTMLLLCHARHFYY
eukprot:GEZU01024571.1.p1 GENE.GEZU01024571.1~~GEZU01024571.1.p1  ORF type:complete len:176 (+),score=16.74 GEZU01024571.1:62-529(+)